jgi:diaminohydroxyphosphoribosylaminopyrimidine deaminase / 5-amino-6-(5-phosphoribosylamino)uracil reductase
MQMALFLAKQQTGRTAGNPAVGCVIVAKGHIVGEGATGDGGRPHAEAIALAQAASLALGATVYVTLEPCAHKSVRGPTCTETLVGAGIERLVCCVQDPDPRTAGRGFERLKQAGIKVEIGLLWELGYEQIRTFAMQFDS